MADVNIDRLVLQERLKRVWFELTKKMFKIYPYFEVIDLTMEAAEERDVKQFKKLNRFVKSKYRQLIDKELKISEVARKYDIKVKNNKAVCPFHADKDPSLSLNDSLNVFNCFGCGAKGDIIEFIRRLEEIGKKRGNKDST